MNETMNECLKSFHEINGMWMLVHRCLHDIYHINLQEISLISQTRFLRAEAELHLTTLRQYMRWFDDAAQDAHKILCEVSEKVGFGASDEQLVDLKNQIQLLERRAAILRDQARIIWETALSLQDDE